MTAPISINGDRLLQRLDDFAAIGATPAGGVNRQALTVEDRAARSALARLAAARGYGIYQDGIANLFIRREGRDPSRPAFLIGSHLDSQPTGGRFDGALGTLAAFEVLETLDDAGIETEGPVEAVAWMNEEGSRFAPGSMGSAAFAEGRIPLDPRAITGVDGTSLAVELDATLRALPEAKARPVGFPVSGYLELHIEQGPSLEMETIPVGVVEGIQGTRWLEVRVTGQAGHAGTTPLNARRDPMAATASGLSVLYSTVMPGDERARLTVGRIAAEPGSINAIPSAAVFNIDLRHPETARLNEMEALAEKIMGEAATANGCTVATRRIFDMLPAMFPEPLINCIERAAKHLDLPVKRMVSGAFHDALFVSRVAPAAMIFVPCRDGLSHNENEFVEPEHSVLGAQVLLRATLEALAELEGAAR